VEDIKNVFITTTVEIDGLSAFEGQPLPNYNFIDRSHRDIQQGQSFSINKILRFLNINFYVKIYVIV